MSEYRDNLEMAQKIARAVEKIGGRAYFVGGYVRDALRGAENKDIDIEIHGVAPKELEKILDMLGERISIGESFGVYALKGYSIDIAMPRKEKVRGKGHKDFDIFVDPDIGTERAATRRDFTVNAMLRDVLTGEIIDHFGGRTDLENKVLRHVNDESFPEDPLRVLRGAQFAARFGYTLAPETANICKNMSLSHLPKERIEGELKKALLKSDKPSVFFKTLRETESLDEWFPELRALIGIQQSLRYHKEGDVWVHTMMVLDAAAKYRDRTENPFGFMLACLTHDFGKAICTYEENGEIHSKNHAEEGLPIVRSFVTRISNEVKLCEYVTNLVELHMFPNVLARECSSIKATNKLFDRAIDPEALICLATADDEGKISDDPNTSEHVFLYERLSVFRDYMSRPYVMGRDLIEAGLSPDEDFSKILEYAHKLRYVGMEKKTALTQTLAYARELRKDRR